MTNAWQQICGSLTRVAHDTRAAHRTAATDFQWSLLPNKISRNSKSILVHSNDFASCQDLLGFSAEAAQVCTYEQGGLEERPQGKVASLLVHCQTRVTHLQSAERGLSLTQVIQ